jgi:Tol biopolymer transport system component
VWFDRNGKPGQPLGPPIGSATIQLSPDGTRVAYSESVSGNVDVWVYNLMNGVKTRLTTDAKPDHNPVWSSDGRRIFFDSHRDGRAAVYARAADGATPEERIVPAEDKFGHSPRAVSPDGRFLMFAKSSADSPPWSLWLHPLAGNAAATPWVSSRFDQTAAAVSPDGRWVAYATDESGAYEVVVQSLSNPSLGKWQVSMNGGNTPRWGRDGRELFYLTRNGDLTAVAVGSGAGFNAGPATTLFKTPFGITTGGLPYDVSPDGQHFLLSLPTADPNAQPMTALLNFPALIKPSAGR